MRRIPTRKWRVTVMLGVMLFVAMAVSMPGAVRRAGGATPSATAGAWVSAADLPDPPGGGPGRAVLLPSGKVLHLADSRVPFIYDPGRGEWSFGPPMPEPRTATHALAAVAGGTCLTACVLAKQGGAASWHLFNVDSMSWTATASHKLRIYRPTATLVAGPRCALSGQCGKVLVVGGYEDGRLGSGGVADPETLYRPELYDPATGVWTLLPETARLEYGRAGHSAVLLEGNDERCGQNCGKVLVVGGSNMEVPPPPQGPFAELYDPATSTWSRAVAGSCGPACEVSSQGETRLLVLSDRRVLAITNSPFGTHADVAVYDPANGPRGRWETRNSVPRTSLPPVVLPSGEVLLIGGREEPPQQNQWTRTYVYAPDTQDVLAVESMTMSRRPRNDMPASSTLLAGPGCQLRCGQVLVASGDGSARSTAELYVPPPRITGLVPPGGPTAGGTRVTITGSGLAGAGEAGGSVSFGGSPAEVVAASDAELIVISPRHDPGDVEVSITTAPDLISNPVPFTYRPPTVSSVSPPNGPATGGTTVSVAGADLQGATRVHFGPTSVALVSVSADGTSLTAEAPPGDTGTVAVTVTTRAGSPAGATSATSAPFTYYPVITALFPARGTTEGGDSVRIAGKGLARVSEVRFADGVAAIESAGRDDSVVATSPAHAVAEAVPVSLTVDGLASMPASTGANLFTYFATAPPENVTDDPPEGGGSRDDATGSLDPTGGTGSPGGSPAPAGEPAASPAGSQAAEPGPVSASSPNPGAAPGGAGVPAPAPGPVAGPVTAPSPGAVVLPGGSPPAVPGAAVGRSSRPGDGSEGAVGYSMVRRRDPVLVPAVVLGGGAAMALVGTCLLLAGRKPRAGLQRA